jgi:beta-glucosidase/6-phospho-beta-glucosidase/beta-galactosidase
MRIPAPALLLLALAACADEPPRGSFPDGFLFGAATAGFQVEMGCPTLPAAACTDAGSDWYAYVTSPRVRALSNTHILGGDPARTGPGHWELFASDYDLARDGLHNNSFRMSIEWSRVFPRSTVGVSGHAALRALASRQALDTYRAMFEALARRGLRPLVTIHHYTLPLWIHDGEGCTLNPTTCTARGWLDRQRIVAEMQKFAGFVAREFGGQVDLWATQNEPFAVVVSSFLQPTETRTNPPAVFLDADASRASLLAMIEAHARVTDAVRQNDTVDADGDGKPAQVGLVYAMAPVLPRDPQRALDRAAAENVFYLWNLLFLDATALGLLDANLEGKGTRRADLVGRMDFIGLNYKSSIRVEGVSGSLLPRLSPLLTLNPFTLDYSLVQPRGLYEICQLLQQRYRLPIYITENNGQQLWKKDEADEARFLTQNLQWVSHAIARGIDIRGFFYWAFSDNYEWNHGMTVDLGLYAVDENDPAKRRRPRSLVPLYGQVARDGAVSAALRERYPVDLAEPPTGGVPAADLFLSR